MKKILLIAVLVLLVVASVAYATYLSDVTFLQWTQRIESTGRGLVFVANDGEGLYWQWQTFRAGRTNAEIATALGKSEATIAEMDAALAVFYEVKTMLNNGAVYQGDRMYSLRKFL